LDYLTNTRIRAINTAKIGIASIKATPMNIVERNSLLISGWRVIDSIVFTITAWLPKAAAKAAPAKAAPAKKAAKKAKK